MQQAQGVTDPVELNHVHDVTAAVALIALWEAAKLRGAVAMRWDGQRWVVSIAGKWEEADIAEQREGIE